MKIPPITDPLGSYWDQPPAENIELVETLVASISRKDFDKLHNYSHSVPSELYVGKMWKSLTKDGWYLRWVDVHPDPSKVRITSARIVINND